MLYTATVYLFTADLNPLGLYATISAGTLGLSWLAPTSFQAINESYYVMGDLNNGIVLLRDLEGKSGRFSLVQLIDLMYGDSVVAALRLYPKQNKLYVLSRGGYLSICDLGKLPYTCPTSINPVSKGEQVLLNNVMDFDQSFIHVAYLVSVSGQCCIRIIDLTRDWISAAYTTTSPLGSASSVISGNVQVISFSDDEEAMKVAVLVPDLSPTVAVYSIYLSTHVYVYKGSTTQANFTMQVIARNTISKATAQSMVVSFNFSEVDDPDNIVELTNGKEYYQQWWFWASVGFGLIVGSTIIALLFIRYYHRNIPKHHRPSIPLQPLYTLSSRYSRVS